MILDNTATNGRHYTLESGNTGSFLIYDSDGTATRFLINSSGNVGIGTSSPQTNTKLHVSGPTKIGSKTIYDKVYSSLDTNGQVVGGLTTGYNGNSARFVFEMHGNTGEYQRIVYACYNGGGTWNTKRVIDEGTDAMDVTASGNAATIVFTFKSKSGTLAYSPMITVEHVGHSLETSYL